MDTRTVITAYFEAFNAGDAAAMLELLAEDVEHHVNQGGIRRGKAAFAEFCAHMERCYSENLTDLVIFAEGDRAAAEFTVNGTYKADDEGLPPAHGQTYRLPAGSFFALKDGRIARVTTYYNLEDWIAQVS
ncbi:ketosteroid isomerase-related protein [Mangrovicoccus algicola]|uniref:Nuclear transport factor 2 family protein n=1 Tax=Mangrovicoccus algicola TaxID=2771008 RepID=A0A8J6YSN4_9RHOB|nr:ketosteroid isomerase-related protein [Mangrovicoccus algicola]MBE3637037.1 nuclear transport factor 2 family protein [Mangrovicoccus algicola]